MKNRLVLLAAMAIAAAGILGASQAQANVYCANSATPGTCTSNSTGGTTAVQAAVLLAQINPGPDTVRIGTGVFTTPTATGDFNLTTAGSSNTLNIVGEGSLGNATLKVQNTDNQSIIFDAGGGSTMSNVSIAIPGSGGGTALWVRNSQGGAPPVVTDANIYKEFISNNPSGITGVELQDGASLTDSSVDVSSTNFTTAVQSDGAGAQSVATSYLAARRGVNQAGGSDGSLTLSRSNINASQFGLVNDGGTLNLNDSLVTMPPVASSSALASTSSSGFVDTEIDGSTIIGGPTTTGALLTAQADPDATLKLQLNNSVMSLGGNPVFAYIAGPNNAVTFHSNHSAYNTTKVVRFDSSIGPFNKDEQNPVDLSATSPGFTNAAGGDYTPAASSPLVDAGFPIDPPAGAKDLNGNPRACHGTASGVIQRDIGAFEYKTDPNDDCTYPAALVAPPAAPVTDTTPTIGLSTSKPGVSTFTCSLDGGAFSACGASFTTPALSLGAHDLKVRAKDTYGNIQQVPTDAAFTIAAASCANTPSVCPPNKDTTPPTVKIISAPKQVRAAKAKIRFSSSEAGSKFTCKVNKAKARSCRSPFKAKLKKGRNTIVIVATDKAGNHSKGKRVVIRRR